MRPEYLTKWQARDREKKQEDMRQLRMKNPPEPEVCKAFGCGNHLTLQEGLHGDYCIHHQSVNGKWLWK
jgi:hypothetical protein